jgi:sulfite exporter TauE/SafE
LTQINVDGGKLGHRRRVSTSLDLLAAWCGAAPLAGGLWVGLFVAGLAGGPMHCGPMCGGFVLGQVADGLARVPAAGLCEMHRLRAAVLLPYHLGRLSTYVALGAAAGLGGSALAQRPATSGVLFLLAALLFLGLALRRVAPAAPAWLRRLPLAVRRFAPSGGYWLGVSLGLLPCGFLYGALAAAAASGHAWSGALAMLAFGLGTAPTLVGVGLAGHAAGLRLRGMMARWAPVVMAVNATLLLALALRGLIV